MESQGAKVSVLNLSLSSLSFNSLQISGGKQIQAISSYLLTSLKQMRKTEVTICTFSEECGKEKHGKN